MASDWAFSASVFQRDIICPFGRLKTHFVLNKLTHVPFCHHLVVNEEKLRLNCYRPQQSNLKQQPMTISQSKFQHHCHTIPEWCDVFGSLKRGGGWAHSCYECCSASLLLGLKDHIWSNLEITAGILVMSVVQWLHYWDPKDHIWSNLLLVNHGNFSEWWQGLYIWLEIYGTYCPSSISLPTSAALSALAESSLVLVNYVKKDTNNSLSRSLSNSVFSFDHLLQVQLPLHLD